MVKTQVPVELGVYVLGYLKSAPPSVQHSYGIGDNDHINIVILLMVGYSWSLKSPWIPDVGGVCRHRGRTGARGDDTTHT